MKTAPAAAREEVNGRNTLIVAATFGQPGTAGTILPNALQAGHDLVLALDRALAPGVQSGSRHDAEGPPQGPLRAPRPEGPAHARLAASAAPARSRGS
jgi:hypothetical protein